MEHRIEEYNTKTINTFPLEYRMQIVELLGAIGEQGKRTPFDIDFH
jgi:hypothetical protein